MTKLGAFGLTSFLQIEATEEYKQKGLKDRDFFWELLRNAKVRNRFRLYLEEAK